MPSVGMPAGPTSSASATVEVTILKGRPGGLLWFDPTIEQRMGIKRSQVPPALRDEIDKGKDQGSRDAARALRGERAGPDRSGPPEGEGHDHDDRPEATPRPRRPAQRPRPRPPPPTPSRDRARLGSESRDGSFRCVEVVTDRMAGR